MRDHQLLVFKMELVAKQLTHGQPPFSMLFDQPDQSGHS